VKLRDLRIAQEQKKTVSTYRFLKKDARKIAVRERESGESSSGGEQRREQRRWRVAVEGERRWRAAASGAAVEGERRWRAAASDGGEERDRGRERWRASGGGEQRRATVEKREIVGEIALDEEICGS
jgi:hypothetical protein